MITEIKARLTPSAWRIGGEYNLRPLEGTDPSLIAKIGLALAKGMMVYVPQGRPGPWDVPLGKGMWIRLVPTSPTSADLWSEGDRVATLEVVPDEVSLDWL
jgi:hypothetical protein